MKKQYIFLIIIIIILYMSYLILSFTYKEYKTNEHIENISIIIESIKIKIDEAEKIIKYKSSSSYKNKILKEQQSFKNIWENVIFLTTEKIYDKFTKEDIPEEEKINDNKQNNSEINELTIFEKWKNLIYKKNTY